MEEQNDVRLIMMPGMDHCFGGVGPSWVNYLDAIDDWIESGKAPEQLTAAMARCGVPPSVA